MLDRSDPLIVVDEPTEAPLLAPPHDPSATVTTPAPRSDEPRLLIGAVQFTGLSEVSQAALMQAVEPAMGHSLDSAEQRTLLTAVELRLRALGYPLATAMIEPQQVRAGVLRIRIDEGRVDAIRVTGAENPLIARMLAPIVTDGPVRRDQLERSIVLAERIPGVRIVRSRLVQEGALNILVVEVREAHSEGQLLLDNSGTASVGPVKLRGQAELRSVLTAGDEVEFTAITTPADPSNLQLGAISYSAPLDSDGTRAHVSFSAAAIDTVGASSGRDIDSDGVRATLGVSHPLILRQRTAISTALGFAWRHSEQALDGRPVRDDRTSIVNLRIDALHRAATSRLSGHLLLSQGIDVFDATRAGDPLASRRDGDGIFTKIEARATLVTQVTGPLSLRLDGEAQLASRALLSSEEFGFGGSTFGRGYAVREATGDNGIAAAMEVRVDIPPSRLLRSLQIYGYGDAGKLWNISSDDDGLLATAGMGLRSRITDRLGFGIEIAMPVDSDRSPRGNFDLSWMF